MLLSNLKTVFASFLVVGILAAPGKVSAQDKEDKKEPAKAELKKTDSEIAGLNDRLKKLDAEIVKVRAAMLKECEDETRRLDAELKKIEDAAKAGDRKQLADHMKKIAELRAAKAKVFILRMDIEHRIQPKATVLANMPLEDRIGIRLSKPDAALAKHLNLAKDTGLVIDHVRAKSAADKAGLKTFDVLVKLAGKPVPSSTSELRKLLAEIDADTAVDLVVIRDAKEVAVPGVMFPSQREAFRVDFNFRQRKPE